MSLGAVELDCYTLDRFPITPGERDLWTKKARIEKSVEPKAILITIEGETYCFDRKLLEWAIKLP